MASWSSSALAAAAATAALGLLVVSRPAHAQLIGVASSTSTPGAIYSINDATGAATLLTTTPGTRPSFVGADFRQGVLYVSDVAFNGDFMFGTYDLATGAFTQVSNQGIFADIRGLAYRPGSDLFYGVEGSRPGFPIVTIHPVTGAVTTIGDTNTFILGLAFNQASDTLYGISWGGLPGNPLNLVTINTSTAAVTPVGPTGQTASDFSAGLAFDEDNDILYMNLATNTSTPNSLFTVNTATGAATLVGANGSVMGLGIDGLAWRVAATRTAAPEPATLALVGMGLLPVAGAVIRRR